MKKLTLICTLLIWLNVALAADKTIYKYTDEHGVTHYSETKLNDNYKEADLPKLSVVESVPSSSNTTSQSSAEEPMDTGNDTDIHLIAPQAGENIWGSGGDLTVAVAPLSEIQKQKYKIQFVLNNEKTTPDDQTSHTFKLVPRGEHQVQALLITRGQYAVAGQTSQITVYMHQASKK
ncbi:DUF4124 domain-containing protein [Marinicella gelatinilytica]|uniref:DUF4124 domain-containing protein n=1 Tax=Marinicella gelatinilytica TaxID=2996017 RepID=UPI00226091C8|nr:DUF4124 domain-containing protein [Marinicella gelatinilytica]MCX7545928.1 DUF4124 domain-containing protein [Marinicella gelatinilytica]